MPVPIERQASMLAASARSRHAVSASTIASASIRSSGGDIAETEEAHTDDGETYRGHGRGRRRGRRQGERTIAGCIRRMNLQSVRLGADTSIDPEFHDVRPKTQLSGVFVGHFGSVCRARASTRVSGVPNTATSSARLSSELHHRIVRAGSRFRLRSRCRSTLRRGNVSASLRVRALSRHHSGSAGAAQARDPINRLRSARGNQRFFPPPLPSFQFVFAFQRVADGVERFRVHETDRTAPGRVSCAAPAVVHLHPSRRIARVAGVEGSIGATDDVNVVHRGHYGGRTFAGGSRTCWASPKGDAHLPEYVADIDRAKRGKWRRRDSNPRPRENPRETLHAYPLLFSRARREEAAQNRQTPDPVNLAVRRRAAV